MPSGDSGFSLSLNVMPKGLDNIHANGINGHALVVRRGVQPGERVTYYWGSAWSKNDCRNFMEWMLRASNLQHCQNNPLVVMVE